MPRCLISLRFARCRVAAAGLLATLLAACGGGGGDSGGGGGGGGSTNQSPTATFSASPSSGGAPLTVAFDATGSSDPDGSIASYAWSFGDGATASGATASHVFDTAATFTVTLTVTDNRGATAQASQSVAVTYNAAPIASVSRAPCAGNAPLTVFFDGTQSTDAEGAIAAYAWNFGDGSTSTSANPAHVFNAPGVYDVTLAVTDAAGAIGTTRSTVIVSAPAPVPAVAVSGHARFERVPFSANTSLGLDYNATSVQPLRQTVVELLAADGTTLAVTRTDDVGAYAFAAPQNVSARVRVRAQTLQCAPGWDIRVLNNTNADALYVMDSDLFATGAGAALTRDLVADSGWSGFGSTSYLGPRVAAPFAVVDTLRSAARFVQDNGSAATHLPALEVFWSTRNAAVDGDVADGSIGTTSYRSRSSADAAAGIYVLGLENNDTDEFDAHILAHEFQHFLEDAISRSESTGGRHAEGERLDLRLAFSEGFANAYSGMVVGDPLYSDSLGPQQGQRFSFDLERNLNTPAGWFNEGSVQSVVWDLYDAVADGADTVNLGYLPLFEVLTGELRTGPALTSVFPFLASLKTRAGAPVGGIDALADAQNINGTDAWATGEGNDGSVPQSLPVYTTVTLNGAAQRVCGTTAAGSNNKIGNRLFLRFSLAGSQSVRIRAQYTASGSTAPFVPTADPDILLYRNGFLDVAESTIAEQETLSRTLSAGDYVIEVYEWSHVDPTYSAAQRRGNTCFDISVTG